MSVPSPGSKAALSRGCKCPVIDNNHGAGVATVDGKPWFVFVATCPLHGDGDWAED